MENEEIVLKEANAVHEQVTLTVNDGFRFGIGFSLGCTIVGIVFGALYWLFLFHH